jgi:hypothetical protein
MDADPVDVLIEHARQMERMRLQLIAAPKQEEAGEFSYNKEMLHRKLLQCYSVVDSHWWGEGATEEMVTEALKEVADAIGQRSDGRDPGNRPRPNGGDTGAGSDIPPVVAGLDAAAVAAAAQFAKWTGLQKEVGDDS